MAVQLKNRANLSEELLQQRCGPAMMEVPLFGRVADVSCVQ